MCIRDSPSTLEGAIVRLSDKIAYINHDIDDAIRARMFTEHELPRGYTDVLGHSVRERLNNMIHDIILNSMDKPAITMSEGCLLYTSKRELTGNGEESLESLPWLCW